MSNSLTKIDDIILQSKQHNKPLLVDATFLATTHNKPLILFLHGFKGFKDWGHWNLMAEEMARKGFCVVKFNFSHNGTTPSNPTAFDDLEAFSKNKLTIELDDIKVVMDYLFSNACTIPNIDHSKCYLIGHSRGGGIGCIATSEDHRIRGLVTWAGISDFEKRWPEDTVKQWTEEGVIYIPNSRTKQQMPMKFEIAEDYFQHKERLNIENAVKSLSVPYLIIHGTDDPTVNVEEAEKLHQWSKESELLIVKGADHVFDGKHPYDEKELPANSRKILDKTVTFLSDLS
ncbi:MAG: alpha/beta fold hydrolase [Fulvivirga sp.]|nr:alpha/beta fold hydrolase [Fulvivirga sp.]